jgi:hypothetical protein
VKQKIQNPKTNNIDNIIVNNALFEVIYNFPIFIEFISLLFSILTIFLLLFIKANINSFSDKRKIIMLLNNQLHLIKLK